MNAATMIAFFFIGHSNMQGCCAAMDTVQNERVWSYDARRGFYHCTDKDVSAHSGSPTMQFLKRLALLYPDYNFCGLKYAAPCANAKQQFAEQRNRECVANMINSVKGKVTWGGILIMYGTMEAGHKELAETFDIELRAVIAFIRGHMGNDSLPVILGRYEFKGKYRMPDYVVAKDEVIAQLEQMPKIDKFCKLTPFRDIPTEYYCDPKDKPPMDCHHYDANGYRIWSEDAAAILQLNNWDFWSKKNE
jgi:hypothetical protein